MRATPVFAGPPGERTSTLIWPDLQCGVWHIPAKEAGNLTRPAIASRLVSAARSDAGRAHGPLLTVRGLRTSLQTAQGVIVAVDGVSFDIASGEVLGIVGESGCGKSVTALSILGLLPPSAGADVEGAVRFGGHDLLQLPESEMRRLRGNEISIIFQEPMTSLNPLLKVGTQITEPLTVHRAMDSRAAKARALDLLDQVGVPAPARRFDEYPHQLSGGLRQRVMIAMALACEPKLLIADEPTTALDVTTQSQILDLLVSLQQRSGMAVILISHDLGVMAEFADRVLVMYAGHVVEQASAIELFRSPLHPYTEALLGSIPVVDSTERRLTVIDGAVPSPWEIVPGCRFRPRCRFAEAPCESAVPPLLRLRPEHSAACIRHVGYQLDSSALPAGRR